MPRTASHRSASVGQAVEAVKALPRHHERTFRFARQGFFEKLRRLMEALDDVGEFVNLESETGPFVLTVRHR